MEDQLGKPLYFSIEDYLKTVTQLVSSDEIELALYLLDHVPSFYKDHPHPMIEQTKKAILQDLLSVFDYAKDAAEGDEEHERLSIDNEHCYPRGPAIRELVRHLNRQGKVPHIHEVSPSNFWLERGLLDAGLQFTYSFDSLCSSALHKHHDQDEPSIFQPFIFVCFETIEHLWRPEDIVHFSRKLIKEPEFVCISTPTYCLAGGMEWSEANPRPLGHLRTYSPGDLIAFVNEHWPNRHIRLIKTGMQVLVASVEPLGFELIV